MAPGLLPTSTTAYTPEFIPLDASLPPRAAPLPPTSGDGAGGYIPTAPRNPESYRMYCNVVDTRTGVAPPTYSNDAGGGSGASTVVLKMRGLPYAAKESDVAVFLEEPSYGTAYATAPGPYGVVNGSISILRDETGRVLGEATIAFRTFEGAQRALREKHRQMMHVSGSAPRYIELFWSS
jgi:hypothetical protein